MDLKKAQSTGISDLRRVALTILAAACCLHAGDARAFNFETGSPDWQVRWDNTLQYNAGLRTQQRNSSIANNPLFDESDAAESLPKAIAAARKIIAFNSDIVVESQVADLTPANVEELLAGAQLMRDFGLDPSKNPKFHMVTGLADLRTGSQNVYGSAVLYVVEVTSGKIAAYAVPWNRARFLTRAPISANLVLVGMLPFRNPPPTGPAPKIGGAKAAKEKDKEKEN